MTHRFKKLLNYKNRTNIRWRSFKKQGIRCETGARVDSVQRGGAGVLLSFALKTAQSPLCTLGGALPALLLALAGRRVRLECGTLFVETGHGSAGVTLGAIVWAQSGVFSSDGHVDPAIARHEAYHARTVAALGEWGFYLAYLLLAAPWALARRAPWNALDPAGRGNPFERTAYALHDDVPARRPSRRTAA